MHPFFILIQIKIGAVDIVNDLIVINPCIDDFIKAFNYHFVHVLQDISIHDEFFEFIEAIVAETFANEIIFCYFLRVITFEDCSFFLDMSREAFYINVFVVEVCNEFAGN